jgi:ABC-2 type transport system ATP-binding protein
LKDRVGGDVLEFSVPDRNLMDAALRAIEGITDTSPQVDNQTRRVTVSAGGKGSQMLVEAVRRLDAAGVETVGLSLRRPSLDDVFLAVTGHAAEIAEDGAAGRRRGRQTPAAPREN